MWRYAGVIPVPDQSATRLSLGEGLTPLVPGPSGCWLKLDFCNPTLSFKDRGAVVLVAEAERLGAERIVVDSSGNAGSAVAAYGVRAGIPTEVFVPAATPDAKLEQLRRFGAQIRSIAGSRSDTATAAQERLIRSAAFYASHVYNPLFFHGVKTLAYELVEQSAPESVGSVVIPVGNGTLVLGLALGFRELLEAGRIAVLPSIVAVQADRFAPVAALFSGSTAGAAAGAATIAAGIAVASPPRAAEIVAAVRDTSGAVVTVTEEEILAAQRGLAGLGVDVEPTAAVAWAAVNDPNTRERRIAARAGRTVVVLTGAGMKAH